MTIETLIEVVLAVEATGVVGLLAASRIEGHLEQREIREVGWGLCTRTGRCEQPYATWVTPGREADHWASLVGDAIGFEARLAADPAATCAHGHVVHAPASLLGLVRIRRRRCLEGHPERAGQLMLAPAEAPAEVPATDGPDRAAA